jgi:hypothetical protein
MSDGTQPSDTEALAALEPDALEARLDALVATGAAAVPLLLELEQEVRGKVARKLVRRALHQLKSRGIHVDAPERRGVSVLQPLEQPGEEGVVTPIDPIGRRVVFLVSPVRGGAHIYEVALSDREGLLGLRRHQARRRDARSFLRGLRGQHGRAVFVSGAEVRALVRHAVDAMDALPAGFDRAEVDRLCGGAGEHTPGQRLRAEHASDIDATLADTEVRERMEAGRLWLWPIVGEALLELARRITSAETSPLVLSDVQKAERKRELAAEAAGELLDAPMRAVIAARLDESAVFLDADGDLPGALAVLGLADRIRGTHEPLSVEYLQRTLDVSLEIAARQINEEDAGKLVTP